MSRYTIMLLLMLLAACDNDTGEQSSLDGHPLASYQDDVHIITFQFPVTRGYLPLPLYFYRECTKAGVPFCKTPRRQYIDDAKADGYSGAFLDLVIEEYDQRCVEKIEETIERNCQLVIDTALSRLEKIGRTDITEAHLRNPAFWRLQEQAVSRVREGGGHDSDITDDALDRLKKFEAGSY